MEKNTFDEKVSIAREQRKAYRLKNIDREKMLSSEWGYKNRRHKYKMYKNWAAGNPCKVKAYRIADMKRRMSDDCKKLIHYQRTRIRGALKGKGKFGSTLTLIGCTASKLKSHLEKNFTENMTWDNYGDWHVDHIKPCSSFDLTLDEEQRKCFHYSNLQPLWAKDNLAKSDKQL